ncbi:MAG TPA: HAD-IB family hydrolase [Acidimicrobiales bacterium]|nr:HAD-IB family hydrolase [Acidimicrobiales bacterium]
MTAPREGVAAFDFDGTLVPGDSLPRYLARLLGRRRFASTLSACSPAMLAGYRSSGRDGAKAALLMRAVAGVEAARAAEVGESLSRVLAREVRPAMAERLVWHRDQGHRLVLVSASLGLYLQPFGRLTGFDEVIATALEVGPDGLLTGRIHGANVRAAQKAVLLKELLGADPVTVWAYGDSRGDRELLAMADHPTLLGRRRRLHRPSRPGPDSQAAIRPQWTDG